MRAAVVGVTLLIASGWLAGGAAAAVNIWTNRGPEGVCPSAFSINPGDPDRLLVGTVSGDVFSSTDGGANWHFGGASDVGRIEAFAVDSSDPAVVYAVASRTGVLKSGDGGGHWAVVLPGSFEDIAVAAARPATVYTVGGDGVVLRSDDGGETWSNPSGTVLDDFRPVAVASDPVSERTVFLGTRAGVFKTTDGGETWSSASKGLPNGGAANVTSLTTDPRHPGRLFAGIYPTGGTPGGLYRSTDGGSTWALLITSGTEQGVSRPALGPEGSATIYVAAAGALLRSDDAGGSWEQVGPGLALGSSVHLVAADPRAEDVVYAGIIDGSRACGSNLVKSTDGGATWAPAVHGLSNTTVKALAVDPTDSDVVYAAVGRVGLFRSADGGETWTRLEGSPDCAFPTAIVIDPSDTHTLYAACEERGVLKSTDNGRSWVSRSRGIGPFESGGPVLALALDPARPQTLYAGSRRYWDSGRWWGDSLYKTTNGGLDWTASATGLAHSQVTDLAVEPRAPATLYAVGGGLHRSTDGARSWSRVLPEPVTAVAVDPRHVGRVYCTAGDRMYFTPDAGAHWTTFPTGQGDRMSALVVDPITPTTVYAAGYGGDPTWGMGANTGVSRSTDGGSTWARINRGLTNLNVLALAIDPTGTRVHAATNGGGVFDLEISTANPEITVSPEENTIACGESTLLAVTIDPPQLQETVLTLSSSDSARVSVPLTAILPAGETVVSFSVEGLVPGGPFVISVRLPESLGGAVATARVRVVPCATPRHPGRRMASARSSPS